MKFLFFLTLAVTASAQDVVKLLDWDKLAAKASENTTINLDTNLLNLAKGFLTNKSTSDPKVKDLLDRMKGVYVRSLEFAADGEYSMADVDAVRAKLVSSNWSPIVDVKSKKESTALFVKTDGKLISGIVVIAAEPRELTLVNVVGNIDPSELQALGGKFGIPNVHMQGLGALSNLDGKKKKGNDDEE